MCGTQACFGTPRVKKNFHVIIHKLSELEFWWGFSRSGKMYDKAVQVYVAFTFQYCSSVVDVSEWKAINLRLLDCTSSLLTHT